MASVKVSKRKSSAATLEASVPSSCPEVPPEAMELTGPAQKKARMEGTPAYSDIVVSDVLFKLGRDEKTIIAELNGEQIKFNLTPSGAQSLKVIYGFDMDGRMEKRSFNCAEIEKSPNESLAIRVKLSLELQDALEDLDNKCRMLYSTMGKEEWVPLVSYNEKFKTASVKLRVCLTGYSTALKVVDGNEVKKGSGWNFLNGFGQNFTRADAKAVVKLRVYKIQGKAGISLAASELFLKPNEQIEGEDTFADDVEW